MGRREMISNTIQKGEDHGGWGGQKRDRGCVAGILAKPICIVSRSVGDKVCSFPFCQIFTAHLSVSFPLLQSPEWRTKDEWRDKAKKKMALISHPLIPQARLQLITEKKGKNSCIEVGNKNFCAKNK